MPTYLGYIHGVMMQEAPRSSTVQEEGLPNEDRYHLLLLHKQEHDKEALQNGAWLHRAGCEVEL